MHHLLKIITIVIFSCAIFCGHTHASLKAVLVVGPQEDGTTGAITTMNKMATFLRSQSVSVQCFYNEKAIWENIVSASNGAHFFIYSGHGSRMGGGGRAGGLCLAASNIVSSDKIEAELKLAKNAMVLFSSVCNGAGSSASDVADIGIEEATKRVTDYARPFFKMGIGCYYANNLGDGCLDFLKDFFDGKPVKECFTNSASTWCKIEKASPTSVGVGLEISIASTNWGGISTVTTYENGVKKEKQVPSIKEYDIAYVGNPAFTLKNITLSK